MNTMLALFALAGLQQPSAADHWNLVSNAGLEKADATGKLPVGFSLSGVAKWWQGGYVDEITTAAIRLDSQSTNGSAEGTASTMIRGIDQSKGKWVRFTVRGLCEDQFALAGNELALQMDFYAEGGKKFMETAKRLIWKQVETDRKQFAINGDYGKKGASVWRTYEFEELLPFKEVDSVKVSVVMKGGNAKSAKDTNFFVDDFSVEQRTASSRGLVDPATRKQIAPEVAVSTSGMIALGGRWYYRPNVGENLQLENGKLTGTLTVGQANSDRLFYKTDRLYAIFKGTMSAFLLPGHMDENRNVVQSAQYVEDNLRLQFNGGATMRVLSRNIPNHPTAKFPDRYGTQGYNPSYIKAQQNTYTIPVEPQSNPNAIVMTAANANGGLNMGPIGFAVNGVQFFNPYDAGLTEAVSIMDRCCGHPAPDYAYHYHKYPICVNTPFVDRGDEHSTVLGFAIDGFPLYGPYERDGVMARDDKQHPLDGFNGHTDSSRGYHYHVTPGKFPYLIGGYRGTASRRR